MAQCLSTPTHTSTQYITIIMLVINIPAEQVSNKQSSSPYSLNKSTGLKSKIDQYKRFLLVLV